MDIRMELLNKYIINMINQRPIDFEIDLNEMIETEATKALVEIRSVISDDSLSDFDAVEKIVCIFEKYGISAGGRHDFG